MCYVYGVCMIAVSLCVRGASVGSAVAGGWLMRVASRIFTTTTSLFCCCMFFSRCVSSVCVRITRMRYVFVHPRREGPFIAIHYSSASRELVAGRSIRETQARGECAIIAVRSSPRQTSSFVLSRAQRVVVVLSTTLLPPITFHSSSDSSDLT